MDSIISNNDLFEFIKNNRALFENCDNELKCVLCNKILINPHFSECNCTYCKECLLDYIVTNNQCQGHSELCKTYNIDINSNVALDVRKLGKIRKIIIKCFNCDYKDNLCNIIEHIKLCSNIKCPFNKNGCSFNEVSFKTVSNHLHNELYNHCVLISNQLNDLKGYLNEYNQCENIKTIVENEFNNLMVNNNNKLIDENDKLKNELQLLREEINQLKKENLNYLINENKEKEFKILQDNLMIELSKSIKFLYIWKIKNLAQKIDEAKNGINECIISPTFYTRQVGYKLRLLLYPNGHGSNENQYLSLYIQLIKSENDDNLNWPFNETLSISLMNIITKTPVKTFKFCFSTASESIKHCYKKPENTSNRSVGLSDMFSLDELKSNDEIMRNQSIFIVVKLV